MSYYILNADNQPVRCPNCRSYTEWVRLNEGWSVVQQEDIPSAGGTVRVSTVFLGIDHNHSREGPPILWETMIFGSTLDGESQRYSSHADAVRGHAEMVSAVLNAKG